jgi:hypothetical protein
MFIVLVSADRGYCGIESFGYLNKNAKSVKNIESTKVKGNRKKRFRLRTFRRVNTDIGFNP